MNEMALRVAVDDGEVGRVLCSISDQRSSGSTRSRLIARRVRAARASESRSATSTG